MSGQAFQAFRKKWTPVIEEELKTAFAKDGNIPDVLVEAMLYSLTAGGKRIRPLMVLAAAEALAGPVARCVPAAIAVEMVHTYSLIHDDLPAMDNDDYRRGKLSNHKVFGDAMAILAGDALLTHAFYMLTGLEQSGFPPERILRIIRELSHYAGPRGMVGGQAADMLGEQGLTDLSMLEYIHRHKTGDMIIFSLRAGGHLAGANEKQLEALEQFGSCIGLAFQIQDDILDISGDEKTIGKSLKSDEREKKVTFPYFLGLDESRKKVKEYSDQGKEAILQASFAKPELLLDLADYLVDRDR